MEASPTPIDDPRPRLLFVCEHNGGRSQMAALLVQERSGGGILTRSAGPDPAAGVNPAAMAAMAELGLDMSEAKPKLLTEELITGADLVIDVGCEQELPAVPAQKLRLWELDDPAGEPLEMVRPIRAEIERLAGELLGELRA